MGDFKACSAFANNLLDSWWSQWKQQGFASLLPYPELKHAKRHQILKVGDVCLLFYDNKVKGTYRLCVVLELTTSKDDIVRTVKVGYMKRDKSEKIKRKSEVQENRSKKMNLNNVDFLS